MAELCGGKVKNSFAKVKRSGDLISEERLWRSVDAKSIATAMIERSGNGIAKRGFDGQRQSGVKIARQRR